MITSEFINTRFVEGNHPKFYSEWAKVEEAIENFRKKSTLKTFEKLFPEQRAKELCIQYNNLDHNMKEFFKCLFREEKNLLLVNIVENKDLYV